MSLKTNQLKKLSVKKLTEIADSYALKLMAMQELGKREDPKFKQLGLELYHLSELIDKKILKHHKKLDIKKKQKKTK